MRGVLAQVLDGLLCTGEDLARVDLATKLRDRCDQLKDEFTTTLDYIAMTGVTGRGHAIATQLEQNRGQMGIMLERQLGIQQVWPAALSSKLVTTREVHEIIVKPRRIAPKLVSWL